MRFFLPPLEIGHAVLDKKPLEFLATERLRDDDLPIRVDIQVNEIDPHGGQIITTCEHRPVHLALRQMQEAIAVSNNEDPLVVASLFREQAAKYTVERIRGELLPTITMEANYTDRFETSKLTSESESGSLVGRARAFRDVTNVELAEPVP